MVVGWPSLDSPEWMRDNKQKTHLCAPFFLILKLPARCPSTTFQWSSSFLPIIIIKCHLEGNRGRQSWMEPWPLMGGHNLFTSPKKNGMGIEWKGFLSFSKCPHWFITSPPHVERGREKCFLFLERNLWGIWVELVPGRREQGKGRDNLFALLSSLHPALSHPLIYFYISLSPLLSWLLSKCILMKKHPSSSANYISFPCFLSQVMSNRLNRKTCSNAWTCSLEFHQWVSASGGGGGVEASTRQLERGGKGMWEASVGRNRMKHFPHYAITSIWSDDERQPSGCCCCLCMCSLESYWKWRGEGEAIKSTFAFFTLLLLSLTHTS